MRKARVGMVLNSVGFGGVTEVALQLLAALPRDAFDFGLCLLKPDADADPGLAGALFGIGCPHSLRVGIGRQV